MNQGMYWNRIEMGGDVQMGWLKRFRAYTESKLSVQNEDAADENQIARIIEELKAEMAEAQVRIANLSAAMNDERNQAQDIQELAKRRHDEAKLAVIHGDDVAARKALAEVQSFNRQYQLAEEEREKSEETLLKLRNHVQMLENQVHGLSNRETEYLARLHTAELAKMTADISGGLDSRGRAFERMEEKVVRRELEAEAHCEVAGLHIDGNRIENGLRIENGNENDGPDETSATNQSVDEMLQKLQAVLKEEGPTK